MRLIPILLVVIVIMLAFFMGYGYGAGSDQITGAVKHSYGDNALQPDFGDGSGMGIITITGLE